MRSAGLTLVILISICGFSCGEYELLEHQKICKRKADSTYRANLSDLGKELDSLCKSNTEHYYQNALDSMIPIRIEEVKKLIEK